MSVRLVERVASCQEASAASRVNLASNPLRVAEKHPHSLLQIGIYPVETLKTQMMSSTEGTNRTLILAAKRVWALGGLKAYYRGLGVRS
jgi:hypothetical protein